MSAGLILCSGAAFAATPLPPPVPPMEPPVDEVEEAALASPVLLKGRVEATANASEDDDWERDYGIRAILGADFERGDWLRGQAEVEVSVLPELRDAWLRANLPYRGRLQVGRFRPPFGRLEQTSRWDLPIVRRGAISKHAQDSLGYGERRIGVMLSRKGKKKSGRLETSIGLFQGDTLSDGSRAEDLAARVSARPLPWLSVGGGGYVRGIFRGGQGDRYLLGLDAAFERGPFQLVTELQTGPEFLGGLALASWLYGDAAAGGWWFQPALSAELVRTEPGTPLRPLVTPTLGAGRGLVRARMALELGSGRESASSERWARFLVMIGTGF